MFASAVVLASVLLAGSVDEVLAPGVRVSLASGKTGSGTMVAEDLVLTAAHLFFDADQEDPIRVDLFRYDAAGEVVDRDSVEACVETTGDPTVDVAILRLRSAPRWTPSVAPILPEGLDLRLFQKAYVVGCPKGLEPRFTRGRISYIGEIYGARLVGATADVFYGNSGGALMVRVEGRWYLAATLSRMEVAGLQALTFLGYYVHPDRLREFLGERGFSYLVRIR